jgi:uncharacterized membrane protein
MKRVWWWTAVGIVAATAVGSALAYPALPDRLPMHWNIDGEVDRWGDKQMVVPLVPAMMLGLLGLFAALPWLSPKQFTLDTFRATYEYIVALIIALCAYIQVLTLWAGWSGRLDISQAIIGGVCLMTALLGNVLGKVKRNFYVGIRTPWTIASDRVWISTHRIAARFFVAAGLIGLAACLVTSGMWTFVVLMVVMGAAGLIPVVYSLVLYKRLERRGEV